MQSLKVFVIILTYTNLFTNLHTMKKEILIILGALKEAERLAWNDWVDGNYAPELKSKHTLFATTRKGLEEQARGFLKNRVNYKGMATYLLENQNLSFAELQPAVTKIALA